MLKSVAVLTFFWLSAAISSPIALLAILLDLLRLGRLFRPILGCFTRAWARAVLWAVKVDMELEGQDLIPADDRICFVSNHQGDLDIVIMLAIAGRPVGFIAKSEAALFPFINLWIAALGSAFIRRTSPRQGMRAIERGIRSLGRGRAMVIFPEGTRSRGWAMKPFRKGAFKLATRSEATIVPVTIDGSFRAWEAERRVMATRVRVVIHAPVRTTGLSADERKALPEAVEATIASALSGGLAE